MIGCLSISAQALFLRVAFHRKKVYNKTEIVTIFCDHFPSWEKREETDGREAG